MTDYEEKGRLLHSWYVTEMLDLSRRPAPSDTRGGLLLGGLVYGEKYIDRFLFLTVPTLMAPDNARALRHRCRMVLFTDAAGYERLDLFQKEREAAGFPTQVFVIPPPVIDRLKSEDFVFGLLGGTQNLGVQIAARYGMAYHPLFPDHLYSANYIPNLLKLGKRYPGIAQSSVSADDYAVRVEMGAFGHRNGSLTIPAAELGDIGFRHLHPQSAGNLMNRGQEFLGYPESHQCIWQGRDRLHLHCCHMNPVYISPELCAAAPRQYFSAIDTNLPFIMGDEFYVPSIADDMAFLEVSDDSKKGPTGRVSHDMFVGVCGSNAKFSTIYMPYFKRGCEVPIKPQGQYLEAADIKSRQATIAHDIVSYQEKVVQFRKEAA